MVLGKALATNKLLAGWLVLENLPSNKQAAGWFALVWFGSVGFGLIGSLVGCLLCIGWDDQGFTCKSMCPTVHNQARSIGTGRYDNLFPLLVKLSQHQSHPMKLEPLADPAMAKTMTLFSFQDSHDAIPFVLLGDLANGGFSK